MDITIPVTIKHPGKLVHTPFATDVEVGATEEVSTAVLHISDGVKAELGSLFTPNSSAHLTPADLAALYTTAELLAAVNLSFGVK